MAQFGCVEQASAEDDGKRARAMLNGCRPPTPLKVCGFQPRMAESGMPVHAQTGGVKPPAFHCVDHSLDSVAAARHIGLPIHPAGNRTHSANLPVSIGAISSITVIG
jgi:hypothetical protein